MLSVVPEQIEDSGGENLRIEEVLLNLMRAKLGTTICSKHSVCRLQNALEGLVGSIDNVIVEILVPLRTCTKEIALSDPDMPEHRLNTLEYRVTYERPGLSPYLN